MAPHSGALLPRALRQIKSGYAASHLDCIGIEASSILYIHLEIMALYQLTFCYPYLKEYAVTVQHIRNEVETLSGSNWRIIASGEHACAIVFETDVEPEQLVKTLGTYGSDDFQFLLTEIAGALAGYMPSEVWEWIDGRFPRTMKLI